MGNKKNEKIKYPILPDTLRAKVIELKGQGLDKDEIFEAIHCMSSKGCGQKRNEKKREFDLPFLNWLCNL